MSKEQSLGRHLPKVALVFGLIGIPLWLISYIWIPFRFAGSETETVWNVVVASEISAMIAGLLSIILGALSLWRYVEKNTENFRNAKRAVMLGSGVWICIVIFNLVGIFFFS